MMLIPLILIALLVGPLLPVTANEDPIAIATDQGDSIAALRYCNPQDVSLAARGFQARLVLEELLLESDCQDMTLVYRLACALCLAEGVAYPDPLTATIAATELKDDFRSKGCDLGVSDAIWKLEDGLQMYLESLLPNPLLTLGEGDLEALTPAPLPVEGPNSCTHEITEIFLDMWFAAIFLALVLVLCFGGPVGRCINFSAMSGVSCLLGCCGPWRGEGTVEEEEELPQEEGADLEKALLEV